MGFHQGLAGESYDRQYSNKALLGRIWAYTSPYKKQVWGILFTLLGESITGALPAIIVSKVLDLGLIGSQNTRLLYMLVLAVLALQVLGYFFYSIKHRLLARVIATITRDLSSDAFSASILQDMAFHDNLSSGRIVSRITTDTADFSTLVRLTMDVVSSGLQSIFVSFILLFTEWRLALLLFAFVPLVVAVVSLFRKLARKVTTRGMRAMANVNATIKETVSGISVAKNFRQEESIYSAFKQSNDTSFKVNVQRGFSLSIVFPTMRTITGLSIALLVYFGALTTTQGFITAGSWYLVLLSSDRFLMPILNMTSYWTQVQTGLSAAERIFALIDARHSVVQNDARMAEGLQGRIEFRRLSFSYGNGFQVLKDFNLHIQPGENVAIVGHTGAGKSSIARLISRFYEFQEGQLLLDGQDIRSFDLTDLHRHMGIVNQVPFLFDGTVEENILFGRPEISRPEIETLCKQIGNGEWLETFSHGLDTRVGERGSQISMGQRQLVALVRVLTHRPSIFILDEATASIDPFTEAQIQQALGLILKRSTSVLIAHRLSTVKAADRILVLEHGSVVEEGSHQSLLQTNGHYAQLYNTYFRHQSLDYVEETGKLLRPELYRANKPA